MFTLIPGQLTNDPNIHIVQKLTQSTWFNSLSITEQTQIPLSEIANIVCLILVLVNYCMNPKATQ